MTPDLAVTPSPDALLDLQGAAVAMKISPQACKRYLEKGAIPYQTQGRKYLIKRSDVDQWLLANRKTNAKVVTFANHKGGVGKTTSVVAVAQLLASLGKRVLVVDDDPQGNTSKALYFKRQPDAKRLDGEQAPAGLLYTKSTDAALISSQIVKIPNVANLELIPADMRLARAKYGMPKVASDTTLRTALKSLRTNYDYIIIDVGPSMNELLVNAIVASDVVLVPVELEDFSIDGLDDLVLTLNEARNAYNFQLEMKLFLTKVENRAAVGKVLREEIVKYQSSFCKTEILKTSSIPQTQAQLTPPNGDGKKYYLALIQEVFGVGA